MATRPILDQNTSAPMPPSSPATLQAKVESPLATQLPAWDLVFEHTLLVRRRRVSAKPSNPPGTIDVPLNVPRPPQHSAVAPPSPAASHVPPDVPRPPQQGTVAPPAPATGNVRPAVPLPPQQSAVPPRPPGATNSCSNCGAGLEEGSTFCSECGTKQK